MTDSLFPFDVVPARAVFTRDDGEVVTVESTAVMPAPDWSFDLPPGTYVSGYIEARIAGEWVAMWRDDGDGCG